MPRYNQSAEGFIYGGCKVRKRACSSSSSSSLLQSNRYKRAILIRKRGASTTPVPLWKMNVRSPSSGRISNMSWYQIHNSGGSGSQGPVSARKLANALWELNRTPSSLTFKHLLRKNAKSEKSGDDKLQRSIKANSLPQHHPFHNLALARSEESRSNSQRKMISMILKKSGHGGHNNRGLECFSSDILMENEFHSRSFVPRSSIMLTKERMKDLSNSLTASKELLKILSQFWEPSEPQSLCFTVFSALRAELEQAILNVNQVIQEHKSFRCQINHLKEQFAVEIQTWKNKENERISSAIHSIMNELESEKKLRRRVERMNKRLAMDLSETRDSLLQASNELASERRSREMVEHVCNELARGIGEEKAEVEELKRESAKALEDLEKERKMLQLADEWCEARVQMKLSESKLQFEENNALVDQLKNELEAFLATEKGSGDEKGHDDAAQELEVDDQSEVVCSSKANERVEDVEKEDNGVLSEDCDLHSIELNMDSNSRSFNWSYATGSAEYVRSFDENNKGSENNIKASRSNWDGKEGKSRNNSQVFCHDWHEERLSRCNFDIDEDADRYISVKQLRDHLLTGSRIVLPQSVRSPNLQCPMLKPAMGHAASFE